MKTNIREIYRYLFNIGTKYKNVSLIIQRKAKILFGLAVYNLIIATLLAFIMVVTKAYLVSIISIIVIFLCLFTCHLIRLGHFGFASNFYLTFLFIAFFSAIKFDAYINDYETYVFALLGLTLLILASLIGYRIWQMVVVTLFDTIGIFALLHIRYLSGFRLYCDYSSCSKSGNQYNFYIPGQWSGHYAGFSSKQFVGGC